MSRSNARIAAVAMPCDRLRFGSVDGGESIKAVSELPGACRSRLQVAGLHAPDACIRRTVPEGRRRRSGPNGCHPCVTTSGNCPLTRGFISPTTSEPAEARPIFSTKTSIPGEPTGGSREDPYVLRVAELASCSCSRLCAPGSERDLARHIDRLPSPPGATDGTAPG